MDAPARRVVQMNDRGLIQARSGRCVRLVSLIAAFGCIGIVLPAASGAAVLAPWGSNLSATPTMDTANGATFDTGDLPLTDTRGNAGVDQTIYTGFTEPCTRSSAQCDNWMHSGADNTEWNTSVAGGSAAAAQGGQVLELRVKGCAVKDTTAPPSQTSAGVPVNTIEFQSLTPQSGGSYKANVTAGRFQLPFCSDTSSGPNTVTTYQPIHLCVAAGDTVSFYDIGGSIVPDSGLSWYPQGVPFEVIAPVRGSNMDSFTDADIANSVYAPGSQPRGNNSGWGQEQSQEVMLQVIEGVGDDAYGLCPGGQAVEPTDSNAVICVLHPTNVGDPYGTCNAQQQPVRPPRNTAPPTVAVSSNGKPVTGSPVPGNRVDAAPGTWSSDPNQSFIKYAYQWQDCDSNGTNCTPIGGQVGKNPYYYATPGDVGQTIEVAVSATNNANTAGPASSAPTGVVGGPNTPVITSLKLNPSIWNEAQSSTITYYDSEAAAATIKVLQNGTIVKTLAHTDTAKQYGGNGIKLAGLAAGSYQLQVSANNKGTVGRTATLSFAVTSALPVITSPRVNPSSFNSAKGATVTYADSQPGNATLRVLHCSSKKGKKGKRATKHTTQQNACANAKVLKTIHHPDRAGANGVKLTGVAPGRYQLQITATYAGRKSTPVQTPITSKLVRGKRHAIRRALDPAFSPLVFG
jgi:hypothetical protein